jgi:microsomal dipeptidase-like Zn-dependent dipeptidase
LKFMGLKSASLIHNTLNRKSEGKFKTARGGDLSKSGKKVT